MAKSMTKAEVVDHMADKLDMTKKAVREFFDAQAELAYREAKNGFTIPGIGKLVVVQRKARTGVNPQTQEKMTIPAKKVVKFRVAKPCKDAVTGGKKK
jgi:DNA-binding protein HU-beta